MRASDRRAVDALDSQEVAPTCKLSASEEAMHLTTAKGGEIYMAEKTVIVYSNVG
jgi:hypothetical protein